MRTLGLSSFKKLSGDRLKTAGCNGTCNESKDGEVVTHAMILDSYGNCQVRTEDKCQGDFVYIHLVPHSSSLSLRLAVLEDHDELKLM